MRTEYDLIAEQYRRSKHVDWRYYLEQYSLAMLLGSAVRKSVLDLACGEGHYTRLLRALGARPVLGVDISRRMIDLARETEIQRPMGISYLLRDACAVDAGNGFDLVTAVYLFNYARDQDELFTMVRAVYRYLKPGGRLLAVNNNPSHDPEHFGSTRKYGFIKLADSPLEEGTPITYRFFLENETFEIENYHLSVDTHERALRQAGFTGIAWHPMQLAPNAIEGRNRGYWSDFLNAPPVILLEAHKPHSAS